jgi:DNA-binding response OmpR family regulator
MSRVVSRDEILRHAWNDEPDPRSNVIEVLVNRIRRKIDCTVEDARIETVRGIGYRFRRP